MQKCKKSQKSGCVVPVSQWFRCPPFLPALEKYPLIVYSFSSEYDIYDVFENKKDLSAFAFWDNNLKKFCLNNGKPIDFSVAIWGYIGDPPGIKEEQLVQRASLDFWDKPNTLRILGHFIDDIKHWETEP